MPRREVGIRSKNWEISTSPETWGVKLERKHKQMATLIKRHFDRIDEMYNNVVAPILDKHGVVHAMRGLYRSFAEELYRSKLNFSGDTYAIRCVAIAVKYVTYGCDVAVINDILNAFGVTPLNIDVRLNILNAIGKLLNVEGVGVMWRVVKVSSDYEPNSGEFVLVDASKENVTITLKQLKENSLIGVKKIDTTLNVVNIVPQVGNIDGKSSITINTPYESYTLITDGVNWWII